MRYAHPQSSNIFSPSQISISMPSTMPTLKLFVRPQPDVQTLVAGLRGVGRIHQNNLNAFFDAFVFKELTQLIERPTIRPSPFSLASGLLIRPISDARQILNCNDGIELFGFLDDGCADGKVQPLLKASLSARQPFQDLPTSTPTRSCALRGFLLKRCPNSVKSIPNFIQLPCIPTLVLVLAISRLPKSTPITLSDLMGSGTSSVN